MTQAPLDYGRTGVRNGAGNRPAPPSSASRLPTVAVMIVAVLAAGWLRHVAINYQESRARGAAAGAGPRAASALGNMNSFALALLLGGLRGPLAMILWSTREAQKADRNLEDFDTKVEWIRLLQPEFDTVHMFQIWNKAYNISVQMASLPNRYAAILDALKYAADVDRERPGNVNIMNAIAQVYSNKLGTVHSEKAFYRRMVREQSFVPADWQGPGDPRTADKSGQAGWQRRRMEPKLDPRGYLLPELLQVRWPRPANLPPDADWNDGAEMQYLARYQPFPQGLSTFALAYNYAKRAQVLMRTGKQTPLQLSPAVIDSRPAMELSQWAQDEWERGRQLEAQAWGLQPLAERLALETETAGAPPDHAFTDATAAKSAMFDYEMAARVARDAVVEFRHHIENPEYIGRGFNYDSQTDEMQALAFLVTADNRYLKAVAAAGATAGEAEREAALREAADAYQKAIGAYQLIILRYYVDDGMIEATFPKGINKANVHTTATRQQQDEIMSRVRQEMAKVPPSQVADEYNEYASYINRATARLAILLRR